MPLSAPTATSYPLTCSQREVLLHGSLAPGAAQVFNQAIRVELDEAADFERLQTAFCLLAQRHSILRTTFDLAAGTQTVHAGARVPVERIETMEARLGDLLDSLAGPAADLRNGPVTRAFLVRVETGRDILFIVSHHVVLDGWSSGLFMRELGRIYRNLDHDRPAVVRPAPRYSDYGEFEARQRREAQAARLRDFWHPRLGIPPPPLELPCKAAASATLDFAAGSVRRELGVDLVRSLRRTAGEQGLTLHNQLLGAWLILLHRLTGQTDFLTVIPHAGQIAMGRPSLVGHCVRSLPLRVPVDPGSSVTDFLCRVRSEVEAVFEHSDTSLGELATEFALPRCHPLPAYATTTFSVVPSIPPLRLRSGRPLATQPHRRRHCANQLGAWIFKSGSHHTLECLYNCHLHDGRVVGSWIDAYLALLEAIASESSGPISRLPLFTLETRKQLLALGERPCAYPRESTIDDLFTDNAKAFRDRPAIVHDRGSLSYGELDGRARCIFARLDALDLPSGPVIGVLLDRGPDFVAACLAVFRRGGMVVPLDPDQPRERTRRLLADAGATAMVTDRAQDVSDFGIPLLEPSGETSDAIPAPASRDAGEAAFVLYTSGSTGTPKGVLIPHRAIVRLVRAGGDLDLNQDEVLLQVSALSFDVSLFEIWGALLNGGRVVIPPTDFGLREIAESIHRHGVTTLWLTAGLFQSMVDERLGDLAPLRRLITGGDVASPTHIARFVATHPHVRLINGYGPTECTTFATTHRVTHADCHNGPIPIGTPVSNTTVSVLDSNDQPVPPGVRGEIVIGGDAVGLGYLNRPDLTAKRFPLVEGRPHYRTGDLGHWDGAGVLHFDGRHDRQLKIRGFRVEPGEIESAIASHPGVRQVRVAARERGRAGKQLVAWLAADAPEQLDRGALERNIERLLPVWMRPGEIHVLPSLPLDPNGKISTRALLDSAGTPGEISRAEPPRTPDETRIAGLWGELLEIPLPDRDANFFDLGGDSLSGLRLFSRIDREMGVTLPLATLIRAPTVGALAAAVAEARSLPERPQGRGVIVPLRQGTRTLFCVHGGDGAVLFYRPLIQELPPDIGISAIESRELSRNGPVDVGSIEEAAAAYVGSLREVQASGPYALAGYSFGGVVAWEMAVQLLEQGEQVELLGLFDTHNPAFPLRPMALRRRLRTFWKSHADTPLPGRLLALGERALGGIRTNLRVRREQAAAARGPAPANSDLRRVQVSDAHYKAMLDYRPRPYAGKVTLFKASEPSDKYELPVDYHWADLARGGFEIVPVSGRHDTLFDREHIPGIARAIARHFPARSPN